MAEDAKYSTPALDKLKPKRRAFVVAFVCGLTAGNGAASAEAAGYSPNGSNVQASRMLANANVKSAITELRALTVEKAEKALILSAEDRFRICAEIANDIENAPRARLAAIRLDAELRGAFGVDKGNEEIVVDLVR